MAERQTTSPLAMVIANAMRAPETPPAAQIQPTNVAGIYANNDAQNMDAYKAQLAQQNAQFGGLASLGSAGIGAAGKAGAFNGLFGGSGAAAAGSDASTSLASSLGLGSGISDADLLASLALV
jgi:hypothetical protein